MPALSFEQQADQLLKRFPTSATSARIIPVSGIENWESALIPDRKNLPEWHLPVTPDNREGSGNAIINETMALLCWPGEVAVGRKFRAHGAPGAGHQVYEVVGVVGDIRDYSYDQDVFPTFYRPYQELDLQGGPPTFLMRIQTDSRALTPAIRKELKVAEPAMVIMSSNKSSTIPRKRGGRT